MASAVELRVFQNGDDALLVWGTGGVIADCVGFAIQKRQTVDGSPEETWLENRVGFAGETPKAGETKPSTEWPFQTFSWTDHSLDQGELASYRVVPVLSTGGQLQVDEAGASEWSPEPDLGALAAAPRRAYFNRGFVMSQFVASYVERTNRTYEQFMDGLTAADERVLRTFLGGDLRVQLLGLLDGVRTGGGHVFAALFELTDDELIDALAALGSRAHLVLGNGSAAHRADDENADARRRLRDAGADVSLTERFIAPKPLAHNKFLVVTAADGSTAQAVWTGSTNWSITGLCTQLNNGVVVNDPAVADVYLQQWQRLRGALNTFSPELIAGNVGHDVDGGSATVWFTRSAAGVDLEALRAEIDKAKQGIVFLMFQPGGKAIYPYVMQRDGEPNFFLRGVVSQMPAASNGRTLHVSAVGGGAPTRHTLDVVQPDGAHGFGWWTKEVTRREFLGGQGQPGLAHAIIHSKVLLIDPLTDNPTVITGSHNFSATASDTNDENFVILRGDTALATTYLVNIMSAWHHYRWRAGSQSWQGSVRDSSWMAGSLAAHARDRFFWGV